MWYKLINGLLNSKVISSGITIPYLIGAYKLKEDTQLDNETIFRNIFQDMINTEFEKIPKIMRCNDIGQLVIALEDKNFVAKYLKNEIQITNSIGEAKIVVTSNCNLTAKTLDELIAELIRQFEPIINQNLFSWNSNQWQGFSQIEANRIKEIFSENKLEN